jgi:DDE superfamily endonuclease
LCLAQGSTGPVHLDQILTTLAREIVCWRSSTFQAPTIDDEIRLPGKNWPQGFYKRQPEMKPRTPKPLEWERHNIYVKVAQWFTVIEKELQDPAILPENVYNMDEAGTILSRLTFRKVLMHKDDLRRCRGAGAKRTLVTAIECMSADGRCLNPLIIWPTSTLRSDWTTHETPNWHVGCSPSGYSNSDIVLEWFRLVFDPQTKSRASGRPRVLIVDGFGRQESLEVLQFCHANNIILCRLPSHTSHKLQPCDVAVFGPLKTAYRERVEELYHGGVNTAGKQYFNFWYNQARCVAFTPCNIKSGWAKAGLYPFDPDRVLRSIQKPLLLELKRDPPIDATEHDEPLQTPVTSEDLTSLRRRFEHTLDALNDDSRLYLCKLANAGERAMTARNLLFKENHDLFQQNNGSTTRASINSTMVGRGKVMSYEDIVQAQRMRDKKDETATNRRGRRRKSSVPASRRGKKSLAEEVEEAMSAIRASGMESHCFVF